MDIELNILFSSPYLLMWGVTYKNALFTSLLFGLELTH